MEAPPNDRAAEREDGAFVVHPPEQGMRLRGRQAVAVAAIGSGAVYLVWRLLWTGAGALPPTFWLLLGAEAFGWLSLVLYAFMAWRIPGTVRPPIHRRPTADVLVPTYDEPVSVVHATLVGCRRIRYPHTTYLLDDGRRPEMRELAEQEGALYLTRPDNAHAKAGNINAALPRTDGELILFLDADHVPMPDVLDATVGYFEDPQVAMVQTPHDFVNRDSVQHTRSDRHEQSLFYEVIAPGKDRHDGAFWCGSANVIRRGALEEVGGVLTDTVAEDFHTTIAIHARGWHTRYHRETLVQGLAPHDLDAFLLQRDRWARGNLRVFRTKQNPLTCRGLRPLQRLSYTASLLNYFAAYQRLAMLAVLIVTLFSGRLPMHAPAAMLLAIWLPWTVLAFTATLLLGRGFLGTLDSSRYGLLTMTIFVRASWTMFSTKVEKFRVTPKEGVDAGGVAVLRALRNVVIIAGILLTAIVVRVLAAIGLVSVGPMPPFATGVTIGLGVYELWVMAWTVVPLVRRRQRRVHYRVPVELSGRVGDSVVRIDDLSTRGAGVIGSLDVVVGDDISIRLGVPDLDGEVHTLVLPAVVRSRRLGDDGTVSFGCEFVGELPLDTLDMLVEYLSLVEGARTAGTHLAAAPLGSDANPSTTTGTARSSA